MDSAYLSEIGVRIQLRRKQLGYTQEQLADLMDVSVQMISNLERGNKAIRIDNLVRISQILNVSTDFILTGKETAADIGALFSQIEQLSKRDRKMIKLLVDFCLSSEDT